MTLITKTLVFDLDGTLVDTAPDLMAALNHVLVKEGFEALPLERARGMIGAGARALLDRGLSAVEAKRSPAETDALFEQFLEYYTDHIADAGAPYPGVIDAMDRFADEGWKLAVCTNKLEGLSRHLLSELGLLDRFAAVGGGDSFDVKKPDPNHLFQTIALAGGAPEYSVMVGDSETDIATAKAAKVPVVAVDFGYTTEHVSTYAPERIISHFDTLHQAVTELTAEYFPKR